MAREMLFSDQLNRIVRNHLSSPENVNNWEKREVEVQISPDLPVKITYFYNNEKNAVVIPTPLAVKKVEALGSFEPNYEDTLRAIEAQLAQLDRTDFSVSASLLGKGAKELHYVAFHKDHAGKSSIFDSKFSDPNLLLNSAEQPRFFEQVKGIFFSIGRYIALLFEDTSVKSTFLDKEIEVHRLGTQGIFDGVSCGYHSCGAVLAMSDSISQDALSSLESIKEKIIGHKGLDVIAESIFQGEDPVVVPPAISPALATIAEATAPVVPPAISPALAMLAKATAPSEVRSEAPVNLSTHEPAPEPDFQEPLIEAEPVETFGPTM